MASDIEIRSIKQTILKLLKEDEEFRYAVAGLLGLREILEELRRLREDLNRFMAEQEKRWEENNRRWEENNRRWEENAKRWEENNKRWEENNKRWEENARRWEENNRKWEEAYKRFETLENELKKLREDFQNFVKEQEKRWEENNRRWEEAYKRFDLIEYRVSNIELALGALTEASLARYVYEDLLHEFSVRDEKILRRIRNHRIDDLDIDMFIETDRSVYVIEVKVRPRHADVGSLVAKIDVVKTKYPDKSIVGIIAATLVGREVEEYARQKGVLIYRY